MLTITLLQDQAPRSHLFRCCHAVGFILFLLILNAPSVTWASGDIIWNTEVTTTTINTANYNAPPTDSFSEDGVTVTIDYLFPDYPNPGTYSGSSIPTNNYFVTTGNTVGNEPGVLGMGMTADTEQCIRTRFTFTPAIADLSFPLLDIDLGSWRDILLIRATYQGSLVPGTGTIVDSNPTVQSGTPAGAVYTCTDIQNDYGTGLCFTGITANAANTTTRGNVDFNFPDFVDQLEVTYCQSSNTNSSMLSAFGDFAWGYDIDDGFDFGDAAGYGDAWHSTPRTINLETLKIENVDNNWRSVVFENTYPAPPIVVCVYDLPASSDPESVVRINNLTTSGFDVMVQRPQPPTGPAGDPTASDVYCLVAEEGAHTLPDGHNFEAHRITSTDTSYKGFWNSTGEDETTKIINSYSNPVVLGQVMTYFDARFSAFWSYNCNDFKTPPFQGTGNICVGKHVGEDTVTTRFNEDLGYIVVEAGPGSYKDIFYEAGLGASSIKGVSDSPPYSYTGLSGTFDSGTATQEAMNGGNGGWAVFFGNPFSPANSVNLAIDEDTIGDAERRHISEQVGYWLFRASRQPYLGRTRGDAEPGSQNNNNADGDDYDGNNDEDGVLFSSPAGGNRAEIVAEVQVMNDSGGDAYVCAWLDRWDNAGSGTGTFDPGDIADGQTQPCTTVPDNNNLPTVITFTWTSANETQGHTYARFRVCTTLAECNTPNGYATDGEVEDYRLDFDFSPTAVTIGTVGLDAVRMTIFLDSLGVDQMNAANLLELLRSWDPLAAAALSSNAGREDVLAALRRYLDPDGDDQVAVFSWETLEERGTIGFFVDRRQNDSPWTRINNDMLPGLINAPMGGEYKLADPTATTGRYQYRLIEQEARGSTRSYGPFDLELP